MAHHSEPADGDQVSNLPAPRNIRPYSPPNERRPTTRTKWQKRTQLWKAAGWYGASGALYAWDEKPSHHEGSNFKPLWVLAEEEPLTPGEGTEATPLAPLAEVHNPRVLALAQRLGSLQQELSATLTEEQQSELVGITVALGLAATETPEP